MQLDIRIDIKESLEVKKTAIFVHFYLGVTIYHSFIVLYYEHNCF